MAEISSWEPDLRTRLAWWLQQQQINAGRDKYAAGVTGRQVAGGGEQPIGLLDTVNAFLLTDSRDAFEGSAKSAGEGAYGDAALQAGIGGLGLLGAVMPTGGGAVSGVIKRAAPKFVKTAKRFQSGAKEGIYRGSEAFGGITPSKLGSMRTNYIEDAVAGAPYSKYWYDNTSKDLFRIAGHDVPKADNLADVLATTSSSTPVGSNAMYGFKGWNQSLTGDSINTGKYPTRMSQDIADIFAGNMNASGLKRSPYAGGLSVEWRPDPSLLASTLR